MLLGLI